MSESGREVDGPAAQLRVVAPGLYTLLVDAGRPGSRALGVPVGGAADRAALLLGNALVGNPPETPALEVALSGPTLQTDASVACVLCGADFQLAAEGHPRGSLQSNKTFTLAAGGTLNIGAARSGARGYLCIRGGFQAPLILGSRSALEPLSAGITLNCRAATIGRR
ncbi:MAG: allophanate hydrolase subunit 2 family protein, partial [Gemmataceae bacterium]